MNKFFQTLVGEWEGESSVSFGGESPAQVDKVQASMRLMLDERFVLHEYTGSFGGKPLSGTAIYGYDANTNRSECAWMDSFHNGNKIMFSVGKSTDESFSVLGSYTVDSGDGGGESTYGWRTDIEIVNNNTVVIKMTNIFPDGKEEGGVVTRYTRKTGTE